MRLTMIGHSTLLIDAAGKKIITDPYFGTRGNPAYKRLSRPGCARHEMRDADLVLVSHHHWDHTDREYFRLLQPETPIIAPARTGWFLRWKGAKAVTSMKAWESRHFGPLLITAVPAAHTTISLGFVIEAAGEQVYFAGDTYYRPFMAEIGKKFQIDIALMPVTTYRLPMTMGERQAVQAAHALSPAVIIPIHLGITPRSPLLRTHQSAEGFRQRLAKSGSAAKVVILREGESWES